MFANCSTSINRTGSGRIQIQAAKYGKPRYIFFRSAATISAFDFASFLH
jgi:hypothetical protein